MSKDVIGIDLGSRNTRVGMFRHIQRSREPRLVEILSNELGSTCTSSWVAFQSTNEGAHVAVGDQTFTAPNRVYDLKRMLYLDYDTCREYMENWSFEVHEGSPPFAYCEVESRANKDLV